MAVLKRKISLGYKPKPIQTALIPKKSKAETKVRYPWVHISETKLPIDFDDIGKTFNANVKIKLTGMRLDSNENKDSNNYDFELREITFNQGDRR